MTVHPLHVALLREYLAAWEQAAEAGDLEETSAVGVRMVGAVGHLLREHDHDAHDDVRASC